MCRVLFVFIGLTAWLVKADAQTSSRVQRFFNLAIQYDVKKQYERAQKQMERVIELDPSFVEAYSILGAWYFRDHLFDKSVSVFQRAFQSNKRNEKQFSFPYAKSLLYAGKEEDALKILNNFNSDAPEWKQLRLQAKQLSTQKQQSIHDTAYNLGPAFNTADAEMFPCISADGQQLYFTRRRKNVDEDFYMAQKDTCGEWFTATNLGSPPNTPNQEAAQMISADGHYLFFTRCENRSENGWGQGGCDLYMSYRGDSIWSVPQSFGATINTPAYEGMPCLSPDNRELFFVSNRAGGIGGMDIWSSKFENGLWQKPRNLGPSINTAGDELTPFIHPDNNSLYFSSDGLAGLGGADLFLTQRINDTLWTKPANLGMPINSTGDEVGACVNIAGDTLYFASFRDGSMGNFDLYTAKLPDKLKPVPVAVLEGYVYDSLTKERVNYASIYIRDAHTGHELYHFNSNRGDGSFYMSLIAGKTYVVSTDRYGYKANNDTLHLESNNQSNIPKRRIALLPSDYVAPVNDSLVLTLMFPISSQTISDSDKILIKGKLLPLLSNQSGIVFYINGFTDNSGTPMLNEQLSYQRALAVAKEIETLGINMLDMHINGLGETNPIADNSTPEGKNKNRRVEIILRR
ncbi:MAG: PD40 domain-containing protein [Bacteroidetes bacterium]|nr:PD40 domain-containing protein [Bacteroidota bacterium]